MFEIVLHPIVIILWAILLFIPWNLHLRLGLAFVLVCALMFILFAGQHNAGFGQVILSFLMAIVILIWALAGVVQFILRRVIVGEWPKYARHPADCIFVWAGYALLALCVFFYTASRAAGSDHTIIIHMGLFCIAAASFREPGFGLTLGLLTSFSLYHPNIVTDAANRAANGAPHCIFLNQRKTFSTSWQDLTFLTMDKGDFGPHAYVMIETNPPTYGYWSYRKQLFDLNWRTEFANPSLTCPTD